MRFKSRRICRKLLLNTLSRVALDSNREVGLHDQFIPSFQFGIRVRRTRELARRRSWWHTRICAPCRASRQSIRIEGADEASRYWEKWGEGIRADVVQPIWTLAEHVGPRAIAAGLSGRVGWHTYSSRLRQSAWIGKFSRNC